MRTAAPRPRRRDFLAHRDRILAAARRLIAERGPESLTVSEVARLSGINRTTAYQHFRTRDTLVGAVMESIAEEFGEMLTRPMSFGERVDHMARFFAQHPEIGRLTLHHLLDENPFPRKGWDLFIEELRRLARSSRSQPGVDPEVLAHILVAIAVLWPLQARVLYEEEEVMPATERLAREVKRLFLYGVLRPEQWPELVKSIGEPEKNT